VLNKVTSSGEIHVIGAGGLARDFASCFQNEIQLTGFWDDGVEKGTLVNGIPVLGTLNDLCSHSQALQIVIMIANPLLRKNFALKLNSSHHSSPVIVHSLARIFNPDKISIGNGCVVFPGTMITTEVEIGEHTLIHTNCSIHHDSKIGSYCVLLPGARLTGNVNVGNEVLVGANVALTNGMNVANGEKILLVR
jgi:sugar O-acyltransferase (sialic acid O-acetyltransferase NeuD family)